MKGLIVTIARLLWLNNFISNEFYVYKCLSLGIDAVNKSHADKYNWSWRIFK